MDQIRFLRLLAIGGACLVGFWIPIRLIGFNPPMALEIFFGLVVSGISIFNLILHFKDSGDNPKQIKSWLKLSPILDVICVLPFSLFAFLALGASPVWILVLNLFAIRHVRHIKAYLDCFDSLQPITYRLVPIFVMLPLLVHLIACGWIALGSGTAGIDSDAVLTYVKAIYWTFTTVTTVGYGDISAKTIAQMLYACSIQVIGVGVFGFILSNVAGLLARSDAAREHHMDNLDKIETYMRSHKTPPELKAKIRTYYHYMWTNKKGYQDDTLLIDLPGKIQAELLLHINKSIIDKIPFLEGADPEFVGKLMTELRPRVFVPHEKIFGIDDMGDALYFIQSGEVEILSREEKLIATLRDGAFFGEMALISDKPRTATAISKCFCDIYVLRREAFEKVMTAHPNFREHIEGVMHQRRAA